VAATQSTDILRVLKRSAALLREAGIDFALGGGLSAWARGGPPTENDVDLLIRESDADLVLRTLAAAGMRTERPPEGWLVKAWDDGVLVDLMYAPAGIVVDDEFLARCDTLSVSAVEMRVMPLDDLIIGKLLALSEHHLDFAPLLEHSRALREQIDWDEVRARTQESPFARAFLYMLDEIDVVPRTVESREVRPAAWSRTG
jgi:predicted nucleotidyltransferase